MDKMTTSGCGFDRMPEIVEQVIREKELAFPDVYMYRQDMVKLSLEVKEKEGTPFCMLPFHHVTEAAALGGRVNYGDGKKGPRGGDCICTEVLELLELPRIDYTAGTIRETLEACRMLAGQGETVVLEMSGPFTIMNTLIDIGKILRAMRKAPELMEAVFDKLKKELLMYLDEAAGSGVKLISYSDSVGGADILGPRDARRVAEQFTWPFLKEAEKILGDRMTIILCPKAAVPLVESGKATVQEVIVGKDAGMAAGGCPARAITYGEACAAMAGRIHFTGQMCVRNMDRPLPEGKIEEIILT